MPVRGARDAITTELASWPGVSARREIGHIHGDQLVDIPLPTRLRDEVVAAGRAEPHHILADSGWISCYLRQPDDVARAIELLRLSYEAAARQKPPDEPQP